MGGQVFTAGCSAVGCIEQQVLLFGGVLPHNVL